jgi:hypothetical protein
MFGWGRKSKSSAETNMRTFKMRVAEFWDWYEANAERFLATINRNACGELAAEVETKLNEILPGIAWVFGPGFGEGNHSFTLTGEGFMPKQLLTEQWLLQQRQLTGWTFHPSKQPTPPANLAGIAIELKAGSRLTASDLQVATSFDQEQNHFDIVCSHPAFKSIPEDQRNFLVMLFLDEALGEFGTSQYIGAIEFGDPPPNAKVMSLPELPSFLEHARKYHDWEPRSIMTSYSVYELSSQNPKRPRGDTIGGTSLVENVIAEFSSRGKPLKDNCLRDVGAEISYLRFPTNNLDSEQLVESRSQIEEAIDDALRASIAGRTLGGAIGERQSYIDLLLTDGQNSREIVLATIKQFALHGEVAIETML